MWAVGHCDAVSSQAKLPQEVTDRIPAITWFAVSGHVNGGVQVMVKAETKTDEAAANPEISCGFVALAKLQAGNRLRRRRCAQRGDGRCRKTVSLSFGVSTQLIDAMTPKKRDTGDVPRSRRAQGNPEAPEKSTK